MSCPLTRIALPCRRKNPPLALLAAADARSQRTLLALNKGGIEPGGHTFEMAVSMGRTLLGLVFVIAGTVSAAAAATSLVVLGDWGINVDVQRLVASRIASLPNRPTGVISTGDNFYYQGVADEHDAKFKSGFEDVFGQLGLPWYVTAGNHDCRGNVTGQVKYSKLNPQWNMYVGPRCFLYFSYCNF